MADKDNNDKAKGGESASAAVVTEDREELPKAIVRRLVKEKLSQLSKDSEFSVLREALQAFSESSRIFIHYLSATANDVRKEAKRQILSAEDVFKALEEIDFPEFVEPLRASLEELRKKNAAKKSLSPKKSDQNQKGKRKEPTLADEEGNEDGGNSDEASRQKNAGKKSAGSTKKSKRNDKRKQQTVSDREDEDGNDKVEDSSDDD